MAIRTSRRDVLKGSAAIAATVFASPLRAQAPAPEPITPALIEAAKKEGKLVFYTAMDLQLAERFGKTLRGEISRHRGARRTLRRRARVPAHRPGIPEQYPRRRRRQHRRPGALHHLEAQRLARSLICRRKSPRTTTRRFYDPDALDVTTRVLVSPFGYNTKLVKAEDAPKSFADLLDPEMGGQDGQGASGLQRHDHERDLPDRARSRLGVFREARQAARHAGAVGDRHAEEDRARRARDHGRRRRLSA